ncbi:ADP-ribosylglycohydrolase family protein [Sandaracinus amylolyticus]|uniref:ADP-ribosylglycohydrolase family protein n=1 Tax=Sandaracinus amylolyticus TaxID=927083 RepID=UPI001F4921A9|nr:ADP-ribosylglycohydrolase family protein [Sandaracinus amylolyticus]
MIARDPSVSRADRIAGGVIGLLVGDALGVPYEFHAPADIPTPIEMEPPSGFRRSHARIAPGTYSDDGAHALALLTSLLHRGALDLDDLGRRLVNWYEWGELAVDGDVFDVGVQTARAIRAIQSGVDAERAGPSDPSANGNGSLMRVLPLALWHRGNDAELVRDAERQSCVTHGHARARVCCAYYALWARRVLEGVTDPWADAVSALRATIEPGSDREEALEFHVRPDERIEGRGGGYVVDALRSARDCAEEPDFERAVRAAIALGHDTDTTACLTGGIVGIAVGVHGIPARWREALRGREIWQPLVDALIAHAR